MDLKVWTNTAFEGFWPVGTAAVIVAYTKQGAEDALYNALVERGLPTKANEISAMELLPAKHGTVVMLHDGQY